jgi:hypothetical protein
MPRRAAAELPLPDGSMLGVGFKDRDGYLYAQFRHPDGKYREHGTGKPTKGWRPGQRAPVDALDAAARIIARVYSPALPPDPKRVTWEKALADLDKTPDLRPDSIRSYRCAVAALRRTIPELTGPATVTAAAAHRFKREILSGTYARGKASDAAQYKRTPTSCRTYLRSLRSLWSKHFKPLGYVKENVWLDVPYPNAPKGRRVRVPSEEVVGEFFAWLGEKHPGWELPRLFVTVKMVAGCRTIDLCRAKSADLGRDSLTLTAEATKTREARTVPLQPDVVKALRRVAGPVWLWGRSVEESKKQRPNPKVQARTEYDPSTWRWTIQNLFREFNQGRPAKSRLRPHDLRARAFTLTAAMTQSVDATAEAMGADPQTARHYLEAAKAFDRSAILRKAADLLRGGF